MEQFYSEILPMIITLGLLYLWVSFLKEKINSLELNIRYWLSKKKRNFIIVILVNIFGAILYFGVPIGGIIFIIYSVTQMLI